MRSDVRGVRWIVFSSIVFCGAWPSVSSSEDYPLSAWADAFVARFETSMYDYQTKSQEVESTLKEVRDELDRRQRNEKPQMWGATKDIRKREKLEADRLSWLHGRIENAKLAIAAVRTVQAAAPDYPTAVAVRENGSVVVTEKGNRTALGHQIRWRSGLVLETDSEGFVELLSTDGLVIHLDAGSALELVSMDSSGSAYRIDRGAIHAEAICATAPDEMTDSCVSHRIDTGNYSVTLDAGAVGVAVVPSGERRVYLYAGSAVFDAPQRETIELAPNTMVNVDPDGLIRGPLSMNFDWLTRWWE